MSFQKNVFINCPFDDDYLERRRAIMFAITYCGYQVQISETNDSGANRLNNIVNLMRISQLSVHDISYKKSSKEGELARFNMPFELGIDYGLRQSPKNNILSTKKFLILDYAQSTKEKYEYQALMSDIAGFDIDTYGKDKIVDIFEHLTNWFNKIEGNNLHSLSTLVNKYQVFKNELENAYAEKDYGERELKNMPNSVYCNQAKNWTSKDKLSSS